MAGFVLHGALGLTGRGVRAMALAALLAAFATVAAAQPSVGVITNPDWVALPNADDLGAAYPVPAEILGIEGRAVIDCYVTELGRLNRCTVQSEGPPGLGFGAGGIRMSTAFQMSPRRVDGRAIAGGQVRVPITFKLPDPAKPPAVPPMTLPPEVMTAARRLVTAQGWLEQFVRTIPEVVTARERRDRRRIDPQLRRDLIAAMEQGARDRADTHTETIARYFAKTHSLEELRAAAAFFESSAGQAHAKVVWINLRPGPEEQQLLTAWMQETQLAAREAFCRSRDCRVPPPPPPTVPDP